MNEKFDNLRHHVNYTGVDSHVFIIKPGEHIWMTTCVGYVHLTGTWMYCWSNEKINVGNHCKCSMPKVQQSPRKKVNNITMTSNRGMAGDVNKSPACSGLFSVGHLVYRWE